MNNCIYLDYAATTPVDSEALAAALPYFGKCFYNPSSSHCLGQTARSAVERARTACANALNADASEITFTSGGTEAINTALACVKKTGKKHIVMSAIEHDAALSYADKLMQEGFAVDFVKPTPGGTVTPEAVASAMTGDTALVCVMAVNNIVGSIQPVKELARVAHDGGALFFTDAVQAVNSLDIDVKDLDVDLLALSGHKFYAPKGVGLLYARHGVALEKLIVGGEQERGDRGGTLFVPGIVAMGEAIVAAQNMRVERVQHIKSVREAFLNALRYGTPVLPDNAVPDILSVVFEGENAGRLAVALSCAGVCCSVGAACSAGSAVPPKTLTEMSIDGAGSALRFSFGRRTSVTQAVKAARIVNKTVARLKA